MIISRKMIMSRKMMQVVVIFCVGIVSFKLGLRTKLLGYGDTPGKKSGPASGHLGGTSGVSRSNHRYLRSGNRVDVKRIEINADSQKAIISKEKSFELARII
ncbi:uncharacterized protein RCO7_15126 [Rhynchosporium graminicola]|uniref:Uncharacterized protein n=1 Tax=Rhynchosporium graminicola TaxID=2792576 RepID=A0A1E1LL98_9HELO|nr:uncharacterized protein RCO7_15126 [Rhynchosporium commune]